MASVLHLPRGDVPAALREFRRVLVDGGGLYYSVHGDPTRDAKAGPYERDERHFVAVRARGGANGDRRRGLRRRGRRGEPDDWITVLARA